ncbi:FecCD family ABC transporter permease [Rhodococcus baikonurensis]|uniref:FecCD family ABC transporter permease n=1 Tax=Rhodococcus erythropolis group TaxID=2840174 RepID=UPI00209C2E07|nr:iron chelate uptake ABC transporter family permease subunit [Rhodococcus erythropolis]
MLLLALGTAALVTSVCIAVTVGSAQIGMIEVYNSITWHLGFPVDPLPPLRDSIIWDSRVPRVLLAALVGAGLAMTGAVLQSATRNPLADPYLLGISSGASVGAVAVMVLGIGASFGATALTGGAFIGALIAFAAVLVLTGPQLDSSTRLILAGVAVSQLFSSITSFTVMVGGDADKTRGVLFWLLGSLAGASWSSVYICAVVVAGTLICLCRASAVMDALAFSFDTANSLGIRVRRTQLLLFSLTSLTTATLVAFSGAIGFVGLLIPHAVRMLSFRQHRFLIPLSAIAGSVFLIWAETIARTAFSPQEIPVGVVTAIVGVPVFAIIMRHRPGVAS